MYVRVCFSKGRIRFIEGLWCSCEEFNRSGGFQKWRVPPKLLGLKPMVLGYPNGKTHPLGTKMNRLVQDGQCGMRGSVITWNDKSTVYEKWKWDKLQLLTKYKIQNHDTTIVYYNNYSTISYNII